MSERESRHTRDEYSAFGEVVGHKIRKLGTEYEREIAQFKINEILLHASLGRFRQSLGRSQISGLPSTQTSLCNSALEPSLPHETRVPSTATFLRPSSSHTSTYSSLTSPNTPPEENSRSETWDNENSLASPPDTRNFYEEFGTCMNYTAL